MHVSIQDYLEWRGDLPFANVELNEVDALIFTWLIYFTMEDLREKGVSASGMSIRQVYETYEKEFGPPKDIDPMSKPFPVENAGLLFKLAAETDRFGNTLIEDFVEISGKLSGAQFAAGSFLTGDGRRVVVYRGTDTTVSGWKENCRMAYEENIPAQLLAVAYLEKQPMDRPLVVCGHSKGGNLAMYAAIKCREKTEALIHSVYNFDGPGFCFEWQNTEKYARMKDRMFTIVPEDSIIGMLLGHDDNYTVIASEMSSFLQHNAFCWHVRRSQFVRAESRSKLSFAFEAAIGEWLGELDLKGRRDVVLKLFAVVEELGYPDFRDILADPARNGLQILKGLNAWPPQQKERMGRLLVELLRQLGYNVPAAMVEKLIIKGQSLD